MNYMRFKKKYYTVVCMVLLVLLFTVSGCGLLTNNDNSGENNDDKGSINSEDVVDKTKQILDKTKDIVKDAKDSIEEDIKEKVKEELDPVKVFGSSAINIAFFGLDKNEQREETLGSFRTDTIIIYRLDFENNHVGMLSIPRDTYVPIANKGRSDKINHAFPYGGGIDGNGFENSINTVSDFLGGVEIDKYFGMDMAVIVPVIDAIGGVEYNVDVTYTKKGFNLHKGLQTLDGNMAQQYIRFRYTANGDIDRVQRQQKFLLAFLDQMAKKVTVEKAMDIYAQVKGNTYTDISTKQMMALANFLRKLDKSDFENYYVKGSFMNKNKISYWKPNMNYVKECVDKLELKK